MLDWFLNSWPEKEDGEPEEEVFFANVDDLPADMGIDCSFLGSCGIPYITRVRADAPSAGRDIYVPVSFLEDARELLREAGSFIFDDEQEEAE